MSTALKRECEFLKIGTALKREHIMCPKCRTVDKIKVGAQLDRGAADRSQDENEHGAEARA